jgi:hypothetical protein
MWRAELFAGLSLALAPNVLASAAEPPPILQITIEPIRPGKEAEYGAIEVELAALCARQRCPNSYLALLSLDAPKQVYWLVSYESQADVERVAAGYADNQPLLDGMRALAAKKTGIADATTEIWTKLRADSSDDVPWQIGATRFAVIATETARGGAVFETSAGRRFVIAAVETSAAAAEVAGRMGASARVFEVRASWSLPSADWRAANPDLWTGH